MLKVYLKKTVWFLLLFLYEKLIKYCPSNTPRQVEQTIIKINDWEKSPPPELAKMPPRPPPPAPYPQEIKKITLEVLL